MAQDAVLRVPAPVDTNTQDSGFSENTFMGQQVENQEQNTGGSERSPNPLEGTSNLMLNNLMDRIQAEINLRQNQEWNQQATDFSQLNLNIQETQNNQRQNQEQERLNRNTNRVLFQEPAGPRINARVAPKVYDVDNEYSAIVDWLLENISKQRIKDQHYIRVLIIAYKHVPQSETFSYIYNHQSEQNLETIKSFNLQ